MLRRIFPGIWNFRPIISLAMVLKNFQELENQFFKYFQGRSKRVFIQTEGVAASLTRPKLGVKIIDEAESLEIVSKTGG